MYMNILDQEFNGNHSSHFPSLDFMFTKQLSDYNLSYSNFSLEKECLSSELSTFFGQIW